MVSPVTKIYELAVIYHDYGPEGCPRLPQPQRRRRRRHFRISMKNNSNTRTFAEAMGQAMAFGISVTTCDVFNNSTHRGFIHGVRQPNEIQVESKSAFTMDTHLAWRKLMYDTETLAYQRGHTPCTYGTCILRNGDRLFMSIVRHFDYVEDALDGAEAEMTESAVYNIADADVPIYLEENRARPRKRWFL